MPWLLLSSSTKRTATLTFDVRFPRAARPGQGVDPSGVRFGCEGQNSVLFPQVSGNYHKGRRLASRFLDSGVCTSLARAACSVWVGDCEGVTVTEMCEEEAEEVPDGLKAMRPNEYVLLNADEDRDAAHRWHVANTIRKQRGSVGDKILSFSG